MRLATPFFAGKLEVEHAERLLNSDLVKRVKAPLNANLALQVKRQAY